MLNKSFNDSNIAVVSCDTSALGQYRTLIPYNHIINNGFKQFKIYSKIPSFEVLMNFDVIYIQRCHIDRAGYLQQLMLNGSVTSNELNYYKNIEFDLDIARKLKAHGKLIITDFDDNLLEVDKCNNSYNSYNKTKFYDNVIETVNLFDYIHVTSKYLAERLAIKSSNSNKKYNELINKFRIFPNSIDLNSSYIKNLRNNISQDIVTFGFQGGSTHRDDLNIIINAVREVLSERRNAKFLFCSNNYDFNKFQLHKDDYIIFNKVENFNEFVPIPSYYDIGLAPLHDTVFNNSKSFLKIQEYAMYKRPTICSNVGDYKTYDKNTFSSVVLCNNKYTSWKKAIIELIDNPLKRTEIGNNAFKNLSEGVYSLDNINALRIEFYQSLFKG